MVCTWQPLPVGAAYGCRPSPSSTVPSLPCWPPHMPPHAKQKHANHTVIDYERLGDLRFGLNVWKVGVGGGHRATCGAGCLCGRQVGGPWAGPAKG